MIRCRVEKFYLLCIGWFFEKFLQVACYVVCISLKIISTFCNKLSRLMIVQADGHIIPQPSDIGLTYIGVVLYSFVYHPRPVRCSAVIVSRDVTVRTAPKCTKPPLLKAHIIVTNWTLHNDSPCDRSSAAVNFYTLATRHRTVIRFLCFVIITFYFLTLFFYERGVRQMPRKK